MSVDVPAPADGTPPTTSDLKRKGLFVTAFDRPAERGQPSGCRMVALRAWHDHVLLLLEDEGRDVPVEVPIDHGTAHAMRHLHALHAHPARCATRRSSYVDLLLRSLRAAGSWPLCLVVRPGPEPAFWLRIVVDAEPVEIDLDVVNAVVLLLADRLPVTVTNLDQDPWQATIDRLLSDRPA